MYVDLRGPKATLCVNPIAGSGRGDFARPEMPRAPRRMWRTASTQRNQTQSNNMMHTQQEDNAMADELKDCTSYVDALV